MEYPCNADLNYDVVLQKLSLNNWWYEYVFVAQYIIYESD